MKKIKLEIEFWKISEQAKEILLTDILHDLMQLYKEHKVEHNYDYINEEESMKYNIDFK